MRCYMLILLLLTLNCVYFKDSDIIYFRNYYSYSYNFDLRNPSKFCGCACHPHNHPRNRQYVTAQPNRQCARHLHAGGQDQCPCSIGYQQVSCQCACKCSCHKGYPCRRHIDGAGNCYCKTGSVCGCLI